MATWTISQMERNASDGGVTTVHWRVSAKVTSTNVSHTYDDGSYLVPCVLMAC